MATIKYQAHCSNTGWQNPVEDGRIAGTVGEHRGLEAFRITEINIPGVGVQAFGLVKDLGWSSGNIQTEDVGSTGLGKPLQAVRMGLFGENADQYEIFYRLHVEDKGFLNWSKNGELNGTTGGTLQAEAIQIEIHKKDEHWYPYVDTDETFLDLTPPPAPVETVSPPVETVSNRDKALNLARSYVGYITGTSNDSVFGRRYAGKNAGPWCCFAVRSICEDCGITFPKTGYVPDVKQWAKANGRWTTKIDPTKLQAIIFDFNDNGTPDHIGLVEKGTSSGAIALEGNTTGPNGEPIGYWRKTRYNSDINGYVTLT